MEKVALTIINALICLPDPGVMEFVNVQQDLRTFAVGASNWSIWTVPART